MRSHKVTLDLRKHHAEMTKSAFPLAVYCVSSESYESNKSGYQESSIPLSVEATGIPKLRVMLSSFPAQKQFEAFTDHAEGVVSDVLGSMRAWTTTLKSPFRDSIRATVIDVPEVRE